MNPRKAMSLPESATLKTAGTAFSPARFDASGRRNPATPAGTSCGARMRKGPSAVFESMQPVKSDRRRLS